MRANSYYSRKLHSLLGVIPVGFFLVEHLLTNYSATKGHSDFVDSVLWLNNMPLIFFLELFLVWLPLAYHAIYGLYVAFTARNNVTNYVYFRNTMFLLQRVTGIFTFVFVIWHLYSTRVQVALGNVSHEELGTTMHQIAGNPVFFVLYVVGILSAVFHFSNGMWSFLVSWGITVGPRAQKVSTYIWMGVFVIMSVMFIMSLTAFTDPQFSNVPVISHK
ncbi:succinate dehydrogenase cytochrome b558 subunit [Paenibacillus larvae]|uniref:Succinate dehydrogenase cytochrome b558 subunit n=2 Tax=Paenibacillus larvae TaxID=1464 RepID=A0AAP5N0L4_9BACL|nr:succinate dehydrogenase cytochrome b558 subunit [Paenibacillus larvae]AQR77785.1 succinate dehydrogenase [Paenibacillus larvae subsp. larvae]AVF21117.1 succinate dehydrogenase cytochrome b558 subunit SdhC [Paenibacillus larvae subsp. larvae]ETK27821.1 succinate dehydrogenase cytochrome b558 subunit SdhC [Paenibacillus larvae subsp. larvae DSM 25719]MCY7478437.1 succinate dehydrogenase cytochrome b558 subunit [Paenibacillus larvae]MCY7490276.1 succinate dehydrogenase cytochrome b558 subunit 